MDCSDTYRKRASQSKREKQTDMLMDLIYVLNVSIFFPFCSEIVRERQRKVRDVERWNERKNEKERKTIIRIF